MKVSYIALLLSVISFYTTCCAQNRGGKVEKTQVVTATERAVSVTYANGLKAFYAQDYAAAENYFLQVINTVAKHAPAYYSLGKVKIYQRDYEAAAFYLSWAAVLDKTNVWYDVELARVLDLQGNFEKSIPVWQRVCAAEPRNEYFLYYYAEACLQAKKYKEVIAIYDKMEQLLGTSPEITAAKVEIWLHLDDVKGAVAEYDKLIKVEPWNESHYLAAASIYVTNQLPDKALPYFEKVQKLNPDNAEVQFVLGNFYDQKGNETAAFEAWHKAFQSKEIQLARKLPILRHYLSKLAKSVPTKEQYALTQAIIETHPDAVEGWASYGSLLFKAHNYVEAAPYFARALQIDIATFALWQDYLYCLAQSHQHQKIIDREADLVELFPTTPTVYYALGCAYLNMQQAQKSLSYFEKALVLTYDPTEKVHIYKMMANAYHELGDETKEREYRAKAAPMP